MSEPLIEGERGASAPRVEVPAPDAPALARGAHAPRSPRRRRLYLGLAVVVLVAAGVGLWYGVLRSPRDDFAGFQGEWAVSVGGRTTQAVIRVEGDRWTYTSGGQPGRAYRLVLNPAVRPKEIDLILLDPDGQPVTFTHGQGAGSQVAMYGVYTLGADTARVALNPDTRPTALDAPDDPPPLTLTRVKK